MSKMEWIIIIGLFLGMICIGLGFHIYDNKTESKILRHDKYENGIIMESDRFE